MRFVRFITAPAASPRHGRLEGDVVVLLDADPISGMLLESEYAFPLSAVTLLAPVARPSKVIAMGRNYASHVAEMGWQAAEPPVVFLKPPSSIVGPGEPICLPLESEHCEAEGELAVVIGMRARRIAPEAAAAHIFGYTIANDVSARDLMAADGQWARAKGFDSFCPLGPWIDTAFDPTDATIRTTIDDAEVQLGTTAEMRLGVFETVALVSRAFQLEPGDVILTGSPAGRRVLQHGMTVAVTISGLGTLQSPVVAEVPAR